MPAHLKDAVPAHPNDGTSVHPRDTAKSDAYFDELKQHRSAEYAAFEEKAMAEGREMVKRSKLADSEVLDKYVDNAREVMGDLEVLRIADADNPQRFSDELAPELQGLMDKLAESAAESYKEAITLSPNVVIALTEPGAPAW